MEMFQIKNVVMLLFFCIFCKSYGACMVLTVLLLLFVSVLCLYGNVSVALCRLVVQEEVVWDDACSSASNECIPLPRVHTSAEWQNFVPTVSNALPSTVCYWTVSSNLNTFWWHFGDFGAVVQCSDLLIYVSLYYSKLFACESSICCC